MSVKRYWSYAGGDSSMQETETGNYVKYEDYASLERKNIELAVQLANAESKCRELAADNARLKDGVNKAVEDIQCFYDSYGWHVSEDGESETAVVALDDVKGSIEHFALSVKNPATDVFLAEVQAQGVEMFAKNAEGAEQGNGLMKAIARRATKFAAQLRKGAAL